MEILIDSLTQEWQNLVRLTPRLLVALVIFLIMLIFGRLVGRTISIVLTKRDFKPMHTNFFRGWRSGCSASWG